MSEQKLEIAKTLTLSTSHIKESTAQFLNDESREHLTVYAKNEFGWFIYITDQIDHEVTLITDDLSAVIQLALDNECSILCLDADGPIVDELNLYDW